MDYVANVQDQRLPSKMRKPASGSTLTHQTTGRAATINGPLFTSSPMGPGLFAVLLRQRLRWYGLTTGRLLMRRWQSVALLLGLLSPAAMPIILQAKVLASPITSLLSAAHGAFWRFGHLFVLQAVALGWTGIQRESVSGGSFTAYTMSLPMSPAQTRNVNLALLAVTDSVLLVPVIVAVMLVAAGHETAHALAFELLAIGLVVAATLVAQLGYLEARWERLAGVVLGNLLLSLALTDAAKPVGWGWLAGAFAVTVVSTAVWLPRAQWRSQVLQRLQLNGPEPQPLRITSPTVSWHIQLRALFVQQWASSVLRLGAAIGLAFGANQLMMFERFDGRARPTGIFALAVVALTMSGLFRGLQLAHRPMQPFLSALPVSSRFWAYRDTIFVLCLALPPLVVTLYPLAASGVLVGTRLIAISALYLALTALLRWPQLRGGRHGVLLSALLTGLWAWPALAMTS